MWKKKKVKEAQFSIWDAYRTAEKEKKRKILSWRKLLLRQTLRMEIFSLWSLPPLTMLRPKKRMIRHKSQPRPVLSGQFTVITVGSPSFSDCLITTTSSSYKIPICWSYFFPFSSSSFFSFLNLRVGFCCCCCCCCCWWCWCWWWWWGRTRTRTRSR